MSNGLNFGGEGPKEVITSAKSLLESAAKGLLNDFKLEIDSLKKQFTCKDCLPNCTRKGFAEFKNGHIKIPYEHLFTMDLKWNTKRGTLSGISGFHLDLMGSIEKNGPLKFIRKSERNGCYLADLVLGESIVPGKTLFPQHWSREKVVSKIYEAYSDFIKSGLAPATTNDGKYIIRGITQEGIEIEMIITKKGEIKTAYPIIKPEV